MNLFSFINLFICIICFCFFACKKTSSPFIKPRPEQIQEKRPSTPSSYDDEQRRTESLGDYSSGSGQGYRQGQEESISSDSAHASIAARSLTPRPSFPRRPSSDDFSGRSEAREDSSPAQIIPNTPSREEFASSSTDGKPASSNIRSNPQKRPGPNPSRQRDSSSLRDLIWEADPQVCPQVKKGRTSVDLRPELGDTRHQDGLGWCYAYSAADLMTQYLQRNQGECLNPPRKLDFTQKNNMVSAASLAGNEAYVMERAGFLPGVTEERAYAGVRISPYGQERLISSRRYLAGGSSDLAIRNSSGSNPRFPNMRFCLEGEYRSEVDFGGREADFNFCVDNKSQWTALTDQIIDIANNMRRGSNFCQIQFKPNERPKVVTLCGQDSCRGTANTEQLRGPSEMAERLNALVENGHAVQVSYSADMLMDLNMASKAIGRPDHAAVVAGKQLNPQTCKVEYLLRDSQTLQCSSHKLTTNQQRGHIRCERNTDKRGVTLFVEESFFQKHLSEIVYISNL